MVPRNHGRGAESRGLEESSSQGPFIIKPVWAPAVHFLQLGISYTSYVSWGRRKISIQCLQSSEPQIYSIKIIQHAKRTPKELSGDQPEHLPKRGGTTFLDIWTNFEMQGTTGPKDHGSAPRTWFITLHQCSAFFNIDSILGRLRPCDVVLTANSYQLASRSVIPVNKEHFSLKPLHRNSGHYPIGSAV